MRHQTTRGWWRRGVIPALAVLVMSLTWACDSAPPTLPSPTPVGPPSGGGPSLSPSPSPTDGSLPQPSPTRFHVSGRVTDEAGAW